MIALILIILLHPFKKLENQVWWFCLRFSVLHAKKTD